MRLSKIKLHGFFYREGRFKDKGVAIAIIAEITGLTTEEIEKL